MVYVLVRFGGVGRNKCEIIEGVFSGSIMAIEYLLKRSGLINPVFPAVIVGKQFLFDGRSYVIQEIQLNPNP